MQLSEVVLHPLRMRIVRCFLGERRLTTADLGEALPDVPTASLYRHVRLLVDHGVLTVVEERRVRGAVERTYALGQAVIGPEDAAAATVDQLRGAFLTFVAGLVDDFERYLARDAVDPAADRIGFRELGLHLTDAEVDELGEAMSEVLLRYVDRPPGDGRVLRVLSSVLLPRPEA